MNGFVRSVEQGIMENSASNVGAGGPDPVYGIVLAVSKTLPESSARSAAQREENDFEQETQVTDKSCFGDCASVFFDADVCFAFYQE